jgi:hypothetical protein
MSPIVLRPLSKGEILDGAFTLLRRNFVTFVATSLIFMLPPLALAQLEPVTGMIASSAATFCAFGACVGIASDAVLGRTPTIGGAVGTGVRKFLPLALNTLGWVVLMFLAALALVVPGILVWIMGFAIGQVVVIENRWNAFGRSRQLAKKAWGKLSVVLLVSWVITLLPALALGLGAGMFMFTTTADPIQAAERTNVWVQIISTLVGCFTTPFSQSINTLLYLDQRVRKEGFGIEMQAAAIAPAAPAAG